MDDARAGDNAAWESLYLYVYPRLLSFARRQLDLDGARDAVSETMTRAVGGIDRFQWKGAGFEGWLYGILRHVIADRQRFLVRSAQRPNVVDADGSDVADGLVAADEAKMVRAAFDLLRPDEQEILHLRVVAGFTADQVAEILGKRPGTVRTAQSRALAHLRELLAEVDQ